MIDKNNKKKGFVVVIAILTGSLLLSISIAMLGIGVKELNLSSSGRESQFAFYAANSGMECALYWDFANADPDDSIFSDPLSYSNNGNYTCNDSVITSWNPLPVLQSGNATTTYFTIPFGKNCAKVTVEKTSSPKQTRIESRGQTKCDSPESKDRVDRGIRARY